MSIKLIIIGLVVALASFFLIYQKSNEEIRLVQPPTQEEMNIIHAPAVLEIPKLKVKADIEHVGLNEAKAMDVPKAYQNVAWYKLGYKPGETGNVVIAGHFDTPTGSPAVFSELQKLEKDDIIIIWDKESKSVMYKVVSQDIYNVAGFPIDKVFGKVDSHNLHLITCDGDLVGGSYASRLVITAKEI